MTDSSILVETVEVGADGNRQISARPKTSELLSERREDIEAAVAEAVDVMQKSMDDTATRSGWKVAKLEASFGIKLKADAGVILTRVGGEASFDFKITVERT
ncbi:CU044_2847 family protein [Amycolatopsis sp. RTGN1]|uniref:CU044_2847 family protein n=1 Tax=Amycolatopsis ponsaeliensis TaxID=2992142 RepID=UPI002550B248|nr:CU044_2847 family protein [Amycolatopsis sp. RTGN1]